MYINKFKCDKPSLTEFKDGVAFCSVCNKNVYNSEEVNLSELLQSGETICASVPASKIAWLERSVLSLGIVAASLVNPIDSFAQKQIAIDTILVSRTSNYYVGKFVDEGDQPVVGVTISIYDKGTLLRELKNNEDGSFYIEISKKEILLGRLAMKITPPDKKYFHVRYVDIPNDNLDFGAITLEGMKLILRGSVGSDLNQYTIVFCSGKLLTDIEEEKGRDIDILEGEGKYIKFKDPKPSGATFKRNDLNNMIR